jgi:MFS family permease
MISLAGFLSLLALMGILIFEGVWLQRSGLAGPAMSGLLLSIPDIVGVVVAPLAGLLGDRWGNRRIVIGGIVLFLAGSLGLIVTPGTLAAYPPLLLLIGIGLACMITNVGAIALSLRPELRQAISGVFNGSRFFAAVMAPVALTPVYEEFSIRGVLLVIVATSVLLAFVVRPAERGSDR